MPEAGPRAFSDQVVAGWAKTMRQDQRSSAEVRTSADCNATGRCARRFLVVSLDPATRVALPAERVRAVAPVPVLTRVPGAPPALAGLATTRGGALPVLDLARLLDPAAASPPAGRMVLAEAGETAGFLVGGVAGLTADPGPAPILDLPALLAGIRPRRGSGVAAAVAPAWKGLPPAPPTVALVMLGVAGSAYALPLDAVEEVVAVPGTLAPAPEGGSALGAMPWRGGVLPLLSLAALLGRGPASGARAVILRGVGLVAERIGPVLRLPREAIDPVPRALRRGSAAGFARLDDGRTLVGILSAQILVEQARVGQAPVADRPCARPAAAASTEPVVAVTLAGDAYGLPAAAVRRVMPAPDVLTRVPGAPDDLAGILSLRDGVLPVLDLRRRLGLPAAASAGRRLVVVEAGGARAGLLIDGASRLVRPAAGAIRPADGRREDGMITRVAALADGDLPLIDPALLLAPSPRGAGAAGRPA